MNKVNSQDENNLKLETFIDLYILHIGRIQ